jgi:hypothetical protein
MSHSIYAAKFSASSGKNPTLLLNEVLFHGGKTKPVAN